MKIVPVRNMEGGLLQQILIYRTEKDLAYGDIVFAENDMKEVVVLECVGQSFDVDGPSLKVILEKFNETPAPVSRICGVMRMELWEEEEVNAPDF